MPVMVPLVFAMEVGALLLWSLKTWIDSRDLVNSDFKNVSLMTEGYINYSCLNHSLYIPASHCICLREGCLFFQQLTGSYAKLFFKGKGKMRQVFKAHFITHIQWLFPFLRQLVVRQLQALPR